MFANTSALQFKHTHAPSMEHEVDVEENQTGAARPKYNGPAHVTPLSASTMGTFSATTAWRVPRGPESLPQPHSTRTAQSTFKFDG